MHFTRPRVGGVNSQQASRASAKRRLSRRSEEQDSRSTAKNPAVWWITRSRRTSYPADNQGSYCGFAEKDCFGGNQFATLPAILPFHDSDYMSHRRLLDVPCVQHPKLRDLVAIGTTTSVLDMCKLTLHIQLRRRTGCSSVACVLGELVKSGSCACQSLAVRASRTNRHLPDMARA